MKLFDFGAAIAALFFIGALASGAPHTPGASIADCERIDMGGYYNFADPECPAQFIDRADPPVEVAPGEDAPTN